MKNHKLIQKLILTFNQELWLKLDRDLRQELISELWEIPNQELKMELDRELDVLFKINF